ncbi:ubiquitin carboxyl-terminal hydrolase Ubp16 [Cryptococcus neoformans Ze90-1]|nr:ubiquitin carboxyl-terminal hydrolase Ubp16 [Cryptococcus neoformans var. grubii Ze90-1]
MVKSTTRGLGIVSQISGRLLPGSAIATAPTLSTPRFFTHLHPKSPSKMTTASPFLFQSSLHDTGLIHEMLSNPLKFGAPVNKKGLGFEAGMKEVVSEPESPRLAKRPLKNVEDEVKDDAERGPAAKDKSQKQFNGNAKGPQRVNLEFTNQLVTPPSLAKAQIPDTNEGKDTQGLFPSTFDLSWPEAIATAKRAAGLHNPSMACYANATLQVLLHTPPVLRIALTHDEGSCSQIKKKNFCMLCSLKHMAEGSHWSGRKAYAPGIHRSLSQIKKGFSKNRQEDTHEFFRFVTDALQNTALAKLPKDIPEKIKHTSWVYRIWGGRVRSRVVCSRCNNPSDTFDSFLDLSLDVNKQGKKSVLGMLAGFTKEDKLEGDNKYHCERCKRKANATKSFKIDQAPPILTLHLKRFSVNYNHYSGRARAEKFNQPIKFEQTLDIAPYMVNPGSSGTKYRLFGVTCHRGTELRFGHYTSYVRGPSGQWFHADDDDVSPVQLEQVLNDKTAYLLSYIRVENGKEGLCESPAVKDRVNGLVNGNARGMRNDESESQSEAESSSHKSPSSIKRKPTYDPEDPPRMKISAFVNNKTHASSPKESESSFSDEEENKMPPELPKFGYKPKPAIHAPAPVEASSFYTSPIARPSNPLAGMSKKEKKKFKHKEKGKPRHSATPMPFAQGRMGNGRNRQPGVLSRMKGRA